jgi:hypothetical protein
MTPSQDTIKDPKVEFEEALDRFYKNKGEDLGYRGLLEKNPKLHIYFEEVLNRQLSHAEIKYIDLHLEKDKKFPDIKIDGTGILLNVISRYLGDETLNFIKKHIDKLKSQISNKDEDGNNLITVLLKGNDNQEEFFDNSNIEIIEILTKHGLKIDDKNNKGLTCLNHCHNLIIFKNLAQKVDDETLKRTLNYFVENEDLSYSKYYKIFDFAKEERNVEIDKPLKVKIDKFLDWEFDPIEEKNKFVDLVFNHGDEATKTNFIAQLSASIPEERSKFFEDLSEDSRSLILGELNEQLSKQEKFKSTLLEVENHKKIDPSGILGSVDNREVFFYYREERNNFIQEIKDNESRKIDFISELCDPKEPSENPVDKSTFFIGLNPENVQIILDQLKKTVENFKDLKIIERELQPASIVQEQPISPNSSDPRVGDKRPRGDLQEVDGGGDKKIPSINLGELTTATQVKINSNDLSRPT